MKTEMSVLVKNFCLQLLLALFKWLIKLQFSLLVIYLVQPYTQLATGYKLEVNNLPHWSVESQ